ncbi:PREDICTED: serine/threonine protein phosphatase 2A 57 kDa regulatory subunit B' beta isoform-like [Nicotiana attenuata]|uniref:serine/threonine protein phosphatase 2A 57 kDa regulatory subunit B' beta isoform-like n=1 Tax=Nicotiana attenuata TaxID=49451 RepID=UPI0009047007|nr:PREDICTED: serine/threonine protein phosphatase 2A 57 kDa regulatory subunit B' beta isoform-like [Nicotiana attenuata]
MEKAIKYMTRNSKEAQCPASYKMGGFNGNSPKNSPRASSRKTYSPKNSPRASPRKTTTTLKQLLLDSRNMSNFLDSEREELLSLISYCSFTYTFTDPQESPSQQDLKRLKLIQLLSIIKTLIQPLDDQVLLPLFKMLSTNPFRPLPPPIYSVASILPDDDDLVSNPTPSWPHLQIVYDIFLKIVARTSVESLRIYIDHSFLLNLLTLFQSEDQRERDSLKNTDQRHPGIGELPEIWGTIINGFSVPLKEEHKLFLVRVLVPLHKPKGMQVYHRQLAYCVTQFVQKEPELGGVVIRGILRYWPITNYQKEVLLIGELEELVETLDPQQYKELALPLCTKITMCLNSWNSQVAEHALYVWNNGQFWKMASQAMEEVFPVLVERMEKNLEGHWSKNVRQLTGNVKGMLEALAPFLYSSMELKALAMTQTSYGSTKCKANYAQKSTSHVEATKLCPVLLYVATKLTSYTAKFYTKTPTRVVYNQNHQEMFLTSTITADFQGHTKEWEGGQDRCVDIHNCFLTQILMYIESIVNKSTRINPKPTVNRLQVTDLTGEKEKLTGEEDGRVLRQAVDATTS